MEQKKFKNKQFLKKNITFYSPLNKQHFLRKMLNKWVNLFMVDGKKKLLEKNFQLFLKIAYKNVFKNIKAYLKYTLKNSSIIFNIKKVYSKKKKIVKEIPFFLKKPLRLIRAIKTLKLHLQKDKKQKFAKKLFDCTLDVLKNSGNIVSQKQEILQESLKKKIYAHFRWF